MRRTSEYAILSLGVALIISLVLQPSFVFAADMPMTPSTPTTPPTASTPPTEPQTAPKVITCPESSPTCSSDKSITMTYTDSGIVFSAKPTVHEGKPVYPPIHITSKVQSGLETTMKLFQMGIFEGYKWGFLDGMAGIDLSIENFEKKFKSELDDAGHTYAAGLREGYISGYSAGKAQRSLGLTK